jgi:GntR family transcriptional regulator
MSVADFLRPGDWLGKSPGPRYVQLRRRLEDGIARGILAPSSPLPPEREIAALTDLSRVTVRRAIRDLVETGAVVQRQGSGSFVQQPPAPRVEQSLSLLTSFTEDMARRGLESESTWLERGVFLPSPDEVVALGLAAGERVARIHRLRAAGGRPLALERAALPLDLLPDPMAVSRSLYEALARSGHRPVRAIQKISAVNLGEEDARHLGLPPGAAGLSIQRTSYLPGGRVAEFTRSLYRGDAYDFVAELRFATSGETA